MSLYVQKQKPKTKTNKQTYKTNKQTTNKQTKTKQNKTQNKKQKQNKTNPPPQTKKTKWAWIEYPLISLSGVDLKILIKKYGCLQSSWFWFKVCLEMVPTRMGSLTHFPSSTLTAVENSSIWVILLVRLFVDDLI